MKIDISKLASRAGEKLLFALEHFKISVDGKVCADLGSSTGGFVDVLLKKGALKIYSVDTARGMLKYRLIEHPKVIVMERTNALHVTLPEKVDFISIDVNWTKQKLVVPHALELLKKNGQIVSLIKTHYEAEPEWMELGKARVKKEHLLDVIKKVKSQLRGLSLEILGIVESPILGGKGKNVEYLMWIRKK